ncbi:UNKNOWN [Stylonychia lemnae]|uniref:Uncharacterized protein n=1 Tax=Stylonychia lemnae TaxID=5949 RepID=A0A078A1C5_STYLE|nr:UNKNOWN [Stylonychia lemnae]|eukprot:CDW75895.1 UNKNOWN [Stylonychia lemnae]
MLGQFDDQFMMNQQQNRMLEDSQFLPPGENFSSYQNETPPIDQNFIDQKIIQNIQKYISGFMTQGQMPPQINPMSAQINQNSPYQNQNFTTQQLPPQSYLSQQNQPQSVLQQSSPLQFQSSIISDNPIYNSQQVPPLNNTTGMLSQELQKLSLNNTQNMVDKSLGNNQHLLRHQQYMGSQQIPSSNQSQFNQTLRSQISEQQHQQILNEQRIQSDEFVILNMKGGKTELSQAARQKVKRDKAVQTAVNLVDNRTEYETFSYLYDKDQDLIRSEKGSLLKYLRKEVVQNQEFLDRINELEQINQQLQDEILMYKDQLQDSQQSLSDQLERQKKALAESMKNKVDNSTNCDNLNEKMVRDLEEQVVQLSQNLQSEKNSNRRLQNDLIEKQNQIDQISDSTSHQLFNENSKLKQQLQSLQQDVEELNYQIDSLNQINQDLQNENSKFQAQIEEKEKYFNEQVQKIKSSNLVQFDRINQDKDRLQKRVEEKDKTIWDHQAKIEQHEKLILELEGQLDKKKKNKKKNECMECFKKEAEIQTLNAKVLKMTGDTSLNQNELTRQIKQKDMQIQDSQNLIKNLTLQLQQNIQKGGDDPIVQQHIQKLQNENDQQQKLIKDLKSNMEKQAAQFMMQLIQQQPSGAPGNQSRR